MTSIDIRQENAFVHLAGHKFINLNTFRKNGVAVTTPVWFAEKEGKLYVVTGRKSGKVKRLRNSSVAQVAPSTASGKPLGPAVDATARLLPAGEEEEDGYRHLLQKYGWQLRAFEWMWRFRRVEHVILEISSGAPA